MATSPSAGLFMLPLCRSDDLQATQCQAARAEVCRTMITTGWRWAAVISADGRLLGLLCLKASRARFCSDQDVHTRALGEAAPAAVGGTGID